MAMKTRRIPSWVTASTAAVVVLCVPRPAAAQLDPLLFLKNAKPNVILAVDTSARMRLDADGTYYDPAEYTVTGAGWESSIGVTAGATKYRRKFANWSNTSVVTSALAATTSNISVVGDTDSKYAHFAARTRLALVRAAVTQAINENSGVARFGLVKTRQAGTAIPGAGNVTVTSTGLGQSSPTEDGLGTWLSRLATVSSDNGLQLAQAPIVLTDTAGSNSSVVSILSKNVTDAGALIPAGNDTATKVDSPVNFMLVDAKTESSRLIAADTDCRNTIVVLLVGGGEGSGTSGTNDPAATASQFLTVGGRRVPVYVVAIAPPAAQVAQLQDIAKNSGGQYFEITKSMIDAAYDSWTAGVPAGYLAGQPSGTIVVPEIVKAVNTAVQHAFQEFAKFNTAPTSLLPFGPYSEFQVTSPVIGTFDITNAKDINGAALPNTVITDTNGTTIPQRSNLMITAGFTLPGFDGKLRAYRVYKPVADSSAWTGYRFVGDGTPLWIASTPSAASRNLYTVLPDGTTVAFTTANAGTLAAHMNLSTTDAASIITLVRSLPIGAPVSSTPAIFNPPSLDPPPDADYAGFVDENRRRRSLVFVGTNRGILEAIDARLGVEVWGLIPYNLLAKLKTLRDGQSVGTFDYFVDSSPKIADVKVGGNWKTYLFFGEGSGGTFYQALDVTLPDIGDSISPSSDDITSLLAYFGSPARIALKWSFPSYNSFDPTLSTALMPYGDLKTSASAIEKTVGQTWSDPAVGQVTNSLSPYVALLGSGFLPATVQNQSNRGGKAAGTTFYVVRVDDGSVLASKDVGNDNKAETVDNCVAAGDCTKIKNALQSDPLAAGPQGSRFISDAYIGDLDGRIWRFDLTLATGDIPAFSGGPVRLYDDALSQPIFNSMAEIDVGATQRYLFVGTGSDLLPSTGVSQQYKLLGVLDQGTTGSVTFTYALAKVDSIGDDEKVTAFPAVAGDVVFFTTTTFRPAALCSLPDANLYAMTFIGGAAYDSTGDDKVTTADSPKTATIAGVRATAPFVVDQHLVFGTGEKLQLFGDPQDFNNGVGQAGVRILSWREVR
jgi:hypothetical protein